MDVDERSSRNLHKRQTTKTPLYPLALSQTLALKTSPARDAQTLRLIRFDDQAMGESGVVSF